MIAKLPWDTEFFGIATGEWDGDQAVSNAADFGLIYVKTVSEFHGNIPGFENTFSEVKVVFSKTPETAVKDQNILSVNATNADIQMLYALAYESGKQSRFKLDANFSDSNFKKLYRIWIDNSINGKFADEILAFMEEGQPIGLVTYKMHSDYATIGLIAVDPNCQGKGIGKKMLQFVEATLRENNIRELRIPTQLQNFNACAFYTKMGYSIIEETYISHLWNESLLQQPEK